MSGDVWVRLREFADRYPNVEAELIRGPEVEGTPKGVTVVVRREALQAYERALYAVRDSARDLTRDLALDTTGTDPAPDASPVTDDAQAAAFLDAIEDLLDLDEREVMALRAREAEAARGSPGPSPAAPAPLRAYAAGSLSRQGAVAALGLRNYAELLVALGDAGLTPPRLPEQVIEEQAALFVRLWRGED